MSKPHYRAVFISPHLDDATFSCAALISQLAEQGSVLVLNVFTKHPAESRQPGVVLGSQRAQEEIETARYLGYESANLDELDAPCRREAYRSVSKLFQSMVDDDLADLSRLRERLFDHLVAIDFERLYVPLAIGWHVDHMLVHLAFEPWATRADCYYYEDVPYCLIPHATRYRLDELGSYRYASNDRSLAPVSAWRAWREASVAYAATATMRNIQPWLVQKCALPVVSIYLYRLMAKHRRQASLTRSRFKLETAGMVQLDETLATRKVEAMALYRSQFNEYFINPGDCRASLAAYAERISGGALAVERYWQISEPTA